ncbi:enoyl-CoA hydratase/isomerase family protein [Ferrovibrio xuzhouensis]|uniref:Enoyl-CoA hydratase/isomerase family protein n=1 Tax=Ferrovibrio xuzhouensis TaxID=1576914 RepID=A0ABV7VJS5_9PROT
MSDAAVKAAKPADVDDVGTEPLYTVNDGCATIRLNRPKHLNRIQADDLEILLGYLDRAEADQSVRVVVLTGTGRVFSAGYNLGDIAAGRRGKGAPGVEDQSPFEQLTNRLENLSRPTICRLNGPVYGGATDLALCCDFRVGTDGCEMFMPASRLGLHYYPSGMVRYITRLGVNAAKKLFLTAQTIKSDEMLRIGYLTDVVSQDQLDARVAELSKILVAQAPVATQNMKKSVNEIARDATDLAAVAERFHLSLASEDIKEGVSAFFEKRKPVFTGR